MQAAKQGRRPPPQRRVPQRDAPNAAKKRHVPQEPPQPSPTAAAGGMQFVSPTPRPLG